MTTAAYKTNPTYTPTTDETGMQLAASGSVIGKDPAVAGPIAPGAIIGGAVVSDYLLEVV